MSENETQYQYGVATLVFDRPDKPIITWHESLEEAESLRDLVYAFAILEGVDTSAACTEVVRRPLGSTSEALEDLEAFV